MDRDEGKVIVSYPGFTPNKKATAPNLAGALAFFEKCQKQAVEETEFIFDEFEQVSDESCFDSQLVPLEDLFLGIWHWRASFMMDPDGLITCKLTSGLIDPEEIPEYKPSDMEALVKIGQARDFMEALALALDADPVLDGPTREWVFRKFMKKLRSLFR